jgi:hypothetical protein
MVSSQKSVVSYPLLPYPLSSELFLLNSKIFFSKILTLPIHTLGSFPKKGSRL